MQSTSESARQILALLPPSFGIRRPYYIPESDHLTETVEMQH